MATLELVDDGPYIQVWRRVEDDGTITRLLVAVDPEVRNAGDLRAQALAAINGNLTFLALASPTNTQLAAQLRAITRQVDALIRLAVGALGDTTGT